jgi:alkyldihydroxyacetonephosphate synthase
MGKVLEIDRQSRAARIQAGAFGPALEAQLKPHGLTLRHFPQSFEYSTLGGWIATRSGGHFATLYTHIDDFVEAMRVVTPKGTMETRRLPGSGAGPQAERLMLGSEGILGVITEAWMRLQDAPKFRASASVKFTDFLKAAEAVRALSQSGLNPSNCRLIDAEEALGTMAGDGSASLLVLAFESADHPQDMKLARALELVRDHGGVADAAKAGGSEHREGAAGAWRNAFLRAPFYREVLTPLGVIVDTFETAVTWDRFPAFHAEIKARMHDVLARVTGKPGHVTCRFTHVYPDGPAPYFTFQGLGRTSALLEQWQEIKAVANDIVVAAGGTITHHHAVGRDHRPGYARECPPLFAEMMRAAKSAVDPGGIMNPGVLIDPAGRQVGVRGAMAGV